MNGALTQKFCGLLLQFSVTFNFLPSPAKLDSFAENTISPFYIDRQSQSILYYAIFSFSERAFHHSFSFFGPLFLYEFMPLSQLSTILAPLSKLPTMPFFSRSAMHITLFSRFRNDSRIISWLMRRWFHEGTISWNQCRFLRVLLGLRFSGFYFEDLNGIVLEYWKSWKKILIREAWIRYTNFLFVMHFWIKWFLK